MNQVIPRTTASCLYLHGLCSSPGSKKRHFLQEKLGPAGVEVLAPDLNVPTFESLTLSAQVEAVADFVQGPPSLAPVVLVGSSLGGLVSLLYAASHPQQVKAMLLIAPAVRFIGNRLSQLAGTDLAGWESRGHIEMVHYTDNLVHHLGFQIVEDARKYEFDALHVPCPTLIIHGTADEVTSFSLSEAFAGSRPNVSLAPVPGADHSLSDYLEQVWELADHFLRSALT